MSRYSHIAKHLPTIDASQSAEQTQESILPFQHWIDSVEIQSNMANRPGRNTGFTNGPYAEIKESIGKFPPGKKAGKAEH